MTILNGSIVLIGEVKACDGIYQLLGTLCKVKTERRSIHTPCGKSIWIT